MANLIPPTLLKVRGREMTGRVIFTTSIVLACSALVLILGFLPAYLSVAAEREARALILEPLEEAREGEDRSERAQISSIRKRIDALEFIGKPRRITDALRAMEDGRPKGMAIRSISYTHKDGVSTLALSGTAPETALTKAYAETLKTSALFEKVTIPLSALAHTEGGTFSITATGAF